MTKIPIYYNGSTTVYALGDGSSLTIVDPSSSQTLTNKTVSDTIMGEVFDADKTQRDTTLLASTNFIANVSIEINATYVLEIPATSSLEVLADPTQTLSGLYGALPAAGITGRLYNATDTGLILRDNGSTWDRIWGGPLTQFTAPPTSGWSTTTMGTSAMGADKDGRLLTNVSNASLPLRIEYRTLSPTSNYTFTAYTEVHTISADLTYSGICLSNGTKYITFGTSADSTNGIGFPGSYHAASPRKVSTRT